MITSPFKAKVKTLLLKSISILSELDQIRTDISFRDKEILYQIELLIL